VTYRLTPRYSLTLDAFNLTNAKASDIDYYYTSRLPGEPAEGIDDLHTHPLAASHRPRLLYGDFLADPVPRQVVAYDSVGNHLISSSMTSDQAT
jgi:hypothetical protein